MWIKRKEVFAAIALGTVVALLVFYSGLATEKNYFGFFQLTETSDIKNSNFSQDSQPRYQLITETIEGELNKGAFEDTVSRLVTLTEEKNGYVKYLRMTYADEAWSGQMVCKVPPSNVTSFTFSARAIIDANGTVTYINISIEEVNASQEQQETTFSTINFNLKESKPQTGTGISLPLEPVTRILSTSLLWIAQGLAVGVPLCFASLGVVLFVGRGLIPLWKNALKVSRQPNRHQKEG
ncbi:MAG: hypothetical protein ACUVT9_06245 [Candidatus Bathycorpusculaceae bacterium]